MKLIKFSFVGLALIVATQTFATKPEPILETTTAEITVNPASSEPVVETTTQNVTPAATPEATPALTTKTTEAIVEVAPAK